MQMCLFLPPIIDDRRMMVGSDRIDDRPISLTSSVSKVFEKIILKRLNCYADEAELFPEEQAGFRKGRSPIEQAYILREVLDY
jgi:hypothetical protein